MSGRASGSSDMESLIANLSLGFGVALSVQNLFYCLMGVLNRFWTERATPKPRLRFAMSDSMSLLPEARPDIHRQSQAMDERCHREYCKNRAEHCDVPRGNLRPLVPAREECEHSAEGDLHE